MEKGTTSSRALWLAEWSRLEPLMFASKVRF